MDIVATYLSSIRDTPLLGAEEERELAKKIESGDRKAINTLVTANLRLVISVAKKYIGNGLSFSDLIQEGNVGLVIATQKYDWRRGIKFATYAQWWIRSHITQALTTKSRTIRLPLNVVELLNNIRREPPRSLAQTSIDTGVSEDELIRLFEVSATPSSLDACVGENGDTQLADFLHDPTEPTPLDIAEDAFLMGKVEKAMEQLDTREREILEMRYGLDDTKAITLAEIGEKLGVTRERVRQIEKDSFEKLRIALIDLF